MSKRTDAHSPANLVTEDYEFVLTGDNSPEEGTPGWVMQYGDFGLETSRRLHRTDRLNRSVFQCHHCGARMRYFAILEHVPTGELIAVGETCLDNRFELATSEFHALRKKAQLDREKMRIKLMVSDFVAEHPELAFMADKNHDADHHILNDMASRLRRYGSLTERQIEFARKLLAQIAERAAAPVEEPEVLNPVVEGKITITGEILSTKLVESIYGSTLKMLVMDDRRFKVWGTVPSSLPNPERGDRITFSATVERSDDDETFGFFKRPTRGEYLNVK